MTSIEEFCKFIRYIPGLTVLPPLVDETSICRLCDVLKLLILLITIFVSIPDQWTVSGVTRRLRVEGQGLDEVAEVRHVTSVYLSYIRRISYIRGVSDVYKAFIIYPRYIRHISGVYQTCLKQYSKVLNPDKSCIGRNIIISNFSNKASKVINNIII